MKNFLTIAVLALALSACSTTKVVEDSITKDSVKYTQDFGKVEVTFTDKGDWESLKSSATAAVPLDDPAALEQAMNLASMRAKRNIVEFMKTDLQSSKTADSITNAIAKDVAADDSKTRERAGNIATKIQERIAVQADGIIKGAYVVDRKISSDIKTVVVTIQVDKRSMKAAQQFRASMGQ